MSREHTHYCANRAKGCKESYVCTSAPERDEDGVKYCPLNPTDSLPCEDCEGSQCGVCGCFPDLEGHSGEDHDGLS